MLVLARKKNESIVIGRNIRVKVLSVSGGQVRLGIEAPPEIPVHRQEIHEQLNRNDCLEFRSDSASESGSAAASQPDSCLSIF